MTTRILGMMISRALAVFLLVHVVDRAAYRLNVLVYDLGRRQPISGSVIELLTDGVLVIFGLFLWFRPQAFAGRPIDAEEASESIDATRWSRAIFVGLGIYFALSGGVALVAQLLSPTTRSSVNDVTAFTAYWFGALLRLVVGLGLIVDSAFRRSSFKESV